MQDLGSSILGASIVFLGFLAICALIYFIMSSRGLKKQTARMEALHKQLKVGQTVLFCGGVYGELKRVGMDTCDVAVKSGAVLEISRYAIQEIIKK